MALLRIRPKYQLTLPEEVRGDLHVGDFLEVIVVKGGIFLRPMAVVELGTTRRTKSRRR